jgi:hypothetical protein
VLLHGDWLHLASNLLVLFAFGDNVEDALGHLRYALFLALSAAAAAIAYTFLDAAPAEWLIGASGAISGVLAAYLLLWPMARTMFLALAEAEEFAQRQAAGAAPFQPALAVDAFEPADQQHAEAAPRRQRWPATPLRAGRRAQPLDEAVEPGCDTFRLQSVVERMAR